MGIWTDIERILAPDGNDKDIAGRLADEVEGGAPIATTQTALMRLGDAAIAAFYAGLEDRRSPPEPRRLRPDPSWIIESDICWINVRACATEGFPGSFVRAAKLLPAVASDAVLLAPFHPTQFDLCYAPESMTIVDPGLADATLADAGVSPENQLRAFVAACGLLGKTVGYELLPYASQFSRIAMERPHLFRWVALDDERTGLAHADPAFPYRAEDRRRDADLVSGIVASAKEDYGVSTLRRREDDSRELGAAKDKAYFSAIRLCVDNGLWPVPAQARNGVGIPSFLRWDGQGDFPVFSYRDADGLDVGEDAYSVVAPFAFYDDMPTNVAPAGPVVRNGDAVDYYADVFSYWRDSFGFDFVRYNAVDRVFEESLDEEGAVTASDRPSREVVAAAIRASRKGAPGTGALASRKGAEAEAYAALGFDLTMGSDTLRRVDAPFVRDSLALYDALAGRPAGTRAASVCFAVDVPESGATRLWGSALAKVMGAERMRLRHCMARFLSVGRGRRPMFETMGFQDGSTGLYEAGLSVRGLDWGDDEGFAAGYASIERLYARLRPFLGAASITERRVEAGYAWWQMRGEGRSRLIVAVASLETAEGLDPGRISIPIEPGWGEMEGRAYRLPDAVGVGVESGRTVDVDLDYLGFVVVDLTPAFY